MHYSSKNHEKIFHKFMFMFPQKYEAAQLFLTLIITIILRNVSLAENQHIMISEESCVTEDWSNDAEKHITLQPKTGCPLKLSRVEPGQYLDGRPPGKTRLLLEEVLVRPAGGAHPVVCVGPNAPV